MTHFKVLHVRDFSCSVELWSVASPTRCVTERHSEINVKFVSNGVKSDAVTTV